MKPVLFNTPMTRAILDGRKTQTRRVVKTGSYTPLEIGRSKFYTFCDELNGKPGAWAGFYCDRDVFDGDDGKQHINAVYAKLPYQPGDILWVRETWAAYSRNYGEAPRLVYKADMNPPDCVKWRPSIHMPKEAARLFLRVTDVGVEPLQNIMPPGICAEGVPYCPNDYDFDMYDKFQDLWDSTIKKADLDRYGWNANPWVWVISFERITREEAEAALEETAV